MVTLAGGYQCPHFSDKEAEDQSDLLGVTQLVSFGGRPQGLSQSKSVDRYSIKGSKMRDSLVPSVPAPTPGNQWGLEACASGEDPFSVAERI